MAHKQAHGAQAHNQAPQPVAYDVDGRPLYHHPPAQAQPAQAAMSPHPQAESFAQTHNAMGHQHEQLRPAGVSDATRSYVTNLPPSDPTQNYNPQIRAQYGNESDIIHASRPLDPKVGKVSERQRKRHDADQKKYPFLNLSEGEFVMLHVKRHLIGLIIPLALTMILVIILVSVALIYPMMYEANPSLVEPQAIVAGALVLAALSAVGGGVAIWVYTQNQFFLTNESVIQEIQHGLFARHEQTVSLGSIEDASFKKNGIIQHIFDYGWIRLSTEGQETTYRFAYVENPKEQIAILNNAVESFKNGRPVGQEFL